MRLTIQNYKNIIGTYGKWAIVNVVELPDYYSFTVKEPNNAAKYKDIVVKRNGRLDKDGDWIYHFGNGSHNTQCVTSKWFENKVNAVSAILTEYDA
jgi:hypothetical protein